MTMVLKRVGADAGGQNTSWMLLILSAARSCAAVVLQAVDASRTVIG